VKDLNSGTVLLLMSIQQVNLAKEYGSLSQGKPFPQKSMLASLEGGRLQNANLDYDTRHPILLPKDHPVTKAIIVYYHEKYRRIASSSPALSTNASDVSE